jgi:hypothetical protein
MAFPRRAAAVTLLSLALTVGCTPILPQARVPAPPVVSGGSSAPAPRPARATPELEVRTAAASGDVVEAGQVYVAALYAADDDTAARYIRGYGDKLRKDEDELILESLSARPMTWGEAGYTDADPALEFTEVIARVQDRKTGNPGTVYYKLGFKRSGDTMTIDMYSKRPDIRG